MYYYEAAATTSEKPTNYIAYISILIAHFRRKTTLRLFCAFMYASLFVFVFFRVYRSL